MFGCRSILQMIGSHYCVTDSTDMVYQGSKAESYYYYCPSEVKACNEKGEHNCNWPTDKEE
jgi:hypothetical protein